MIKWSDKEKYQKSLNLYRHIILIYSLQNLILEISNLSIYDILFSSRIFQIYKRAFNGLTWNFRCVFKQIKLFMHHWFNILPNSLTFYASSWLNWGAEQFWYALLPKYLNFFKHIIPRYILTNKDEKPLQPEIFGKSVLCI